MSDLIYSPKQIADRLSSKDGTIKVSEDKVRAVIRKECQEMTADEDRMIPGGRVDQNVMFVYAGIFDSVASGRAVTRTPPPVSILRQREPKTA